MIPLLIFTRFHSGRFTKRRRNVRGSRQAYRAISDIPLERSLGEHITGNRDIPVHVSLLQTVEIDAP
jgi:hypothetical protein